MTTQMILDKAADMNLPAYHLHDPDYPRIVINDCVFHSPQRAERYLLEMSNPLN